jgi:hypothetical protein
MAFKVIRPPGDPSWQGASPWKNGGVSSLVFEKQFYGKLSAVKKARVLP